MGWPVSLRVLVVVVCSRMRLRLAPLSLCLGGAGSEGLYLHARDGGGRGSTPLCPEIVMGGTGNRTVLLRLQIHFWVAVESLSGSQVAVGYVSHPPSLKGVHASFSFCFFFLAFVRMKFCFCFVPQPHTSACS